MDKLIFKTKTLLKPFAKLFTNKKIRGLILAINGRISAYTYKRAIVNYYRGKMDTLDTEQKEVLEFLNDNPVNLFPYDFVKKYKASDIEVFNDNTTGLKYSFYDNKKIYFKRSCTDEDVRNICSALIMVQDEKSPHRYLTESFDVSENDIVADIGAAEGDFALSVIEKVRKAYIFETDPNLTEALEATFKPWENKVVIVNKYVSNKITSGHTTLDEYFKDKEMPTFIKVDIEGAEKEMIEGSDSVLSQEGIKIIMACYHRHDDENVLNSELRRFNFATEHSNGYMLSIWDDVLKAPYMRRGLIRGTKK